MVTSDSFIRSILAQPDDNGPRLVYADWLEEQGDPHAELIRVQCEIADSASDVDLVWRLRDRVSELLTTYQEKWLGPLRQLGLAGRFRRGFLDVSINGIAKLISCADALAEYPWVLHFRLQDGSASLEEVEQLARSPHFARLERLDLTRSYIGNDGLQLLAQSPVGCQLTHLVLNHNRLSSSGLIKLVQQMNVSRLTELRLYGNGIGTGGARSLSYCPMLSRLKILDLSYNQVQTVGGEYLAESHYLNHLKSLFVRGNSIGPRGKYALRRRYGPRVHLGNGDSLL